MSRFLKHCMSGLTLSLLGNLNACLLSAVFFFKLTFSKNSFWNIFTVSNSLDAEQARHFVGPDLGPNCLQKLSADNISR